MSKVSIPKGTRDFLPEQTIKRNFLFETIRNCFREHGFVPIETPAMEQSETLLGKYGEEGDRLIFKILNSGDYLSKVKGECASWSSQSLAPQITEKALRYDLTVPFARYVVQNRNDITFPFKRYQIQPVWRADRPQKGRYREFYQCDADCIGSDSLYNEVDLLLLIEDVFGKLGLKDIDIRLNNRKILSGMAELIGAPEHITAITVAIDKLDKIGKEGVVKELQAIPLDAATIEKVLPFLANQGSNNEKLKFLENQFSGIEVGKQGVEELRWVINRVEKLGIRNVSIDLTLARGLNYYTGAIIEVGTSGFPGSICGGGRYDDLTGIFGWEGMSGVGISFGAERIYDIMEDRMLFPDRLSESLDVLFINFGEEESDQCLNLIRRLRNIGLNVELYPDAAKMKKQMKYADSRQTRYVVMAGSEELNKEEVTLKNMTNGEQSRLSFSDLFKHFDS